MDKTFVKTAGWIFLQQIINSVLPLVVVMVLARRLGSQGWGMVAYLTAFAYLATMVVEFGFYISGQKVVIRCRNNQQELSNKISEIISARCCLSMLTFVAGLAAMFFLNEFKNHFNLALLTLTYGIVNGFGFYWVLRGLGLVRESVYIDAIWKILGILIILKFVRDLEDLNLYFLVLLVIQILITVSNLYFINKYICKINISYKKAINGLVIGSHVSISHILGSLVSICNPLILGHFSTLQQVGFYSAAEKIVRLSGQVFESLKMTLFIKINETQNKNNSEITIPLVFMILISIIISIIFYKNAEIIINIIFGNNFKDSILPLKIMSIFPIIYVFNIIFGFLWLVKNNEERKLISIMVITIVINLAVSYLLAPNYGAVGISISFILTELTMAVLFYIIYKYK